MESKEVVTMLIAKDDLARIVWHAMREAGVDEGEEFVRVVVDLMYEMQGGWEG
jgi:hypothetical protein